ncbi:hypothetical protein [Methylocystis parvus]|uniref:hypothetical protein n=1 Tax=Methylocystis parvus TaxID=134 RepID=UPI003C748C3A
MTAGDLFSAAPAPARKEAPAEPDKARRSASPRVCAWCGGFAPFGKGDVRRMETIVWACRKHRKNLG